MLTLGRDPLTMSQDTKKQKENNPQAEGSHVHVREHRGARIYHFVGANLLLPDLTLAVRQH